MKSNLVKKLALGLALAGAFSVVVVNVPVAEVSAAASEATFSVDSITGDYSVINNSVYKNYGTVGKTIHFTTNVSGSAESLGFTYSISNRAVSRPASVYGPYATNKFNWTPENSGLCSVNVTAKDAYGNSKSNSMYVFVNDALKVTSLTSDHPINLGEFTGRSKVGETVEFTTATTGGCFGNKTYTYSIIPRNATPSNRTVTYYNQSSTLQWTPKYSGIYAIQVEAKDQTNNVATKTIYVQVQ